MLNFLDTTVGLLISVFTLVTITGGLILGIWRYLEKRAMCKWSKLAKFVVVVAQGVNILVKKQMDEDVNGEIDDYKREFDKYLLDEIGGKR